ncbi:hypothetical protein RRG08_005025 [Elysia crispata]|uniref:Uncharacterized protein n=1 Tax=Elysia crispata TaxID=231223 RepID=A0AAE1E8U1_9GAST|nr:hypothetical protein RRG08_005025 [Elysia crispata]
MLMSINMHYLPFSGDTFRILSALGVLRSVPVVARGVWRGKQSPVPLTSYQLKSSGGSSNSPHLLIPFNIAKRQSGFLLSGTDGQIGEKAAD